ncbi:MAG: ribonuclease HIII [bacterium]|nr:ribonuclease HIII [bacterium]
MNCVVFKLDERLHEKLIKFYKNYELEKKPPYSKFAAKNYDVAITLYESGKVMFQGIGADIEASIWQSMQSKLTGMPTENTVKSKEKSKEDNDFYVYYSSIGSDETGCGDFFGPVVVVATYINKNKINELTKLGIKDSKKITDSKILEIAPQLMQDIPYTFYVLCNKDFNDLVLNKNYNMVQIKAILHNKVLMDLHNKYQPDYKHAVIDKFVNEKKYFSYLKDDETTLRNIKFYTKGESKCMSVAAASVIARYIFLKEMDKLNKISGYNLHKGAGIEVDNQIRQIIEEKGKDYLYDIAKIFFANYKKLT